MLPTQRVAAALLIVLASASVVRAQGVKQQGAARAAMARTTSDSLWAEFGAKAKKGDAAGLTAMYTDDAVFVDPGFPTAEGRGAIGALIKAFTDGGKVTEHSHVMKSLETNGDLALEHGSWRMGYQEKGKPAPMVSDNRYLIVWKRGPSGKWLLHRDISIPNPPAAK
jgi:ketosteroid isomerase-like protein